MILAIKDCEKLRAFKKELKLLGIDYSFIKLNRDFSRLGYCSQQKVLKKE